MPTPSQRTLRTFSLLAKIQTASPRGRERHASARAAWDALSVSERAALAAELPTNIAEVMELNRGLAINEVAKWRGTMGLLTSNNDVVSAAESGLLVAVYGFGLERGYKFSTYAVLCVRSAILHQFYEMQPISAPDYVIRARLWVKSARDRYMSEHGAEPDDTIIAELAGLNLDQVQTARAIPDVVYVSADEDDEEIQGLESVPAPLDTEQLAEQRAYDRLTTITRAELVPAGWVSAYA